MDVLTNEEKTCVDSFSELPVASSIVSRIIRTSGQFYLQFSYFSLTYFSKFRKFILGNICIFFRDATLLFMYCTWPQVIFNNRHNKTLKPMKTKLLSLANAIGLAIIIINKAQCILFSGQSLECLVASKKNEFEINCISTVRQEFLYKLQYFQATFILHLISLFYISDEIRGEKQNLLPEIYLFSR